jgi:hypothetical protein
LKYSSAAFVTPWRRAMRPLSGLDIAAGYEIVGGAECGIRLLQKACGSFSLPFWNASQLSSACMMAAIGA